MNTKHILFFLLLTLLFATLQLAAQIRYVSHTGSSIYPYTSWETAADSIQKAINASNNGDTIIVANGVYKETLLINRAITLIGSSMDSTIIDGTDLYLYKTVEFTARGTIKNLWIKGKGIHHFGATSVVSHQSYFEIVDCKITNAHDAIFTGYSSPLIKRCIITNVNRAILSPCFPDTCKVVIDSSIIITKNSGESAMLFTYGSPTITNNIIIEEGGTTINGINIDATTRKAVIKNNLISGYRFTNITTSFIADSVIIHNNVIAFLGQSNFTRGAIVINAGYNKVNIKNNVLVKNYRGIHSLAINSDYNLFWENEINLSGGVTFGDSDRVADPMFVKDTKPTSEMNYNFHLQAFSPAIDKGDPAILDIDGSRSDIGMFGGPGGTKYTYLDLAPRPPSHLSAEYFQKYIILKWKQNTEADLFRYLLYRDTIPDFQVDTTKLIALTGDTTFADYIGDKLTAKDFYYKLIAVDTAWNRSAPSEEVKVIITGNTETPPFIVQEYQLLQNYPNPFNPSTKIPYRLKERGYVKVMVYTVLGELLKVLVNEHQEAGYYEVEFKPNANERRKVEGIIPEFWTGYGTDTASGIYLYRIEVIGEGNIPRYADMKKMMLLK